VLIYTCSQNLVLLSVTVLLQCSFLLLTDCTQQWVQNKVTISEECEILSVLITKHSDNTNFRYASISEARLSVDGRFLDSGALPCFTLREQGFHHGTLWHSEKLL